MTATVSMLVPLQTLFGWPAAPAVTPLEALGLLFGIPIVVILVVFAIAKGHAVVRASKHGSGPQASDPVWMGGRATSIMGGADSQTGPSPEEQRRQLERFPSVATAETGTGGASARW